MIAEYKMMWEARTWMKKNESFLPTWHAYVGYTLDLFDKFRNGADPEDVIRENGYDENLFYSWCDAGLVLGHLKGDGENVKSSSRMLKYFTKESEQCIGELLKEMIEMHMPALMNYPEMIETKQKNRFCGEEYGQTVAATSSLIEKKAFSYVYEDTAAQKPKWVLDVGCGTGGYLMKLARKMNKGMYVGVDISKEVVETARKKAKTRNLDHKVKFYYADIESWDVPHGMFDVIMMNNLLHYYSPDAREELFSKVSQYLSPNGTMIVITPLYLERGGQPFSAAFNCFMTAHDNLYPLPRREELVHDSEKAGLTLHSMKTIVKEGSWYYMSFKKS
ncbi:SAM-dependent methyltransferase [Bacillus ectoiniformans]|uniref:class I SAM-dependent methyltransferase n=1 Tax=Bacillus ectoiniformans TaxID=1494429 RepID=UPI00195DF263|nr:class I SAM-dependent methyltransferase [Bacillus ectoiniformans]MBM7648250.1 SAM-dependent methyltransferase [Bacillus ectoiniformans]